MAKKITKLTKNAAFYQGKCIWWPLVKDFMPNHHPPSDHYPRALIDKTAPLVSTLSPSISPNFCAPLIVLISKTPESNPRRTATHNRKSSLGCHFRGKSQSLDNLLPPFKRGEHAVVKTSVHTLYHGLAKSVCVGRRKGWITKDRK